MGYLNFEPLSWRVVDGWESLITTGDNTRYCPISFTPEEKTLHQDECERLDGIEDLVDGLQRSGILPG